MINCNDENRKRKRWGKHIKDAAEHLGKLFGRDLNRKDAVAYNNLYATPETDWENMLSSAKNMDDLRKIWNKMPKDMQASKKMIELKDTIKKEIMQGEMK